MSIGATLTSTPLLPPPPPPATHKQVEVIWMDAYIVSNNVDPSAAGCLGGVCCRAESGRIHQETW
jgi:hypothetical protein